MPAPSQREVFIRELSACQQGLYAYIFAQLPDAAAADDVFQETNLQLWQKFDSGDTIRCVPALARELARFQVLTHRKKRARCPLRFDGELLDLIVSEMPEVDDFVDQRLDAMQACLSTLAGDSRDLIRLRYVQDMSVNQIAEDSQRSTRAIVQALYRIRSALAKCIELRMVRRESGT